MSMKADLRQNVVRGVKGFDSLLQHRIRLAISVLLSDASVLSFSRLKELLEETDGNLGAQLRKLEDAGYIAIRKEFVRRRPVSWYSLRPAGRKALAAHVKALTAVIGGISSSSRADRKR